MRLLDSNAGSATRLQTQEIRARFISFSVGRSAVPTQCQLITLGHTRFKAVTFRRLSYSCKGCGCKATDPDNGICRVVALVIISPSSTTSSPLYLLHFLVLIS